MLYSFDSMSLLQEDFVQSSYKWLDESILDAGCSVDILYFDFAKDFDFVPCTHLISKLLSCGTSGNFKSGSGAFL